LSLGIGFAYIPCMNAVETHNEESTMKDTDHMIFGRTWDQIKRAQAGDSSALQGGTIRLRGGDYGADPLGDGTFKMVPSGDVVTFEERNKRLA